MNFESNLSTALAGQPLFWLGIALVLATLSGESVRRWLGWPRMTGYLGAGLLIAFGAGRSPTLQTPAWAGMLIDGALAVLLFEAGARVRPGWLLNNRRLLLAALADWLLALAALWAVLSAVGWAAAGLPVAIALACGAPAVSLRLCSEHGARGQVSERLLLVSALGALLSIVGSGLTQIGMQLSAPQSRWETWLLAGWSLLGALLLAVALAATVRWVQRHFAPSDNGAMLLVGVLLLALGLARALHCSPLLTPLLAGWMLRRGQGLRGRWPEHFGNVGGLLLVLLFLLLGLSLGGVWSTPAVLLGAALLLARALAKLVGQLLLGPRSGLSLKQSTALGLSLNLMSPVSFALLAEFDRSALPHPPLDGVLVALALLGIAATPLARWALGWSGDIAGAPR